MGGVLRLSGEVPLYCSELTPVRLAVADVLRLELRQRCGLSIQPVTAGVPITEGSLVPISLVVDPAVSPHGAYRLTIGVQAVLIAAAAPVGLFYGVQTLLQLLTTDGGEVALPCVEITDSPRFSWRGMHLDVSRHFFSVDFVKKYIDLLARHKMNVFHWHLTDDQGWRIEIQRYPRLTEVGAFRMDADDRPYGGFYTQQEVRDVVAYASSRCVTIVPEIELPGHATAALAAYPEYSCTGGPFRVATTWGVFDDVYCAGNDATFAFLENIFSEVAGLFPGQYVHIGGDECPKARWSAHNLCQQRMRNAHLKHVDDLQAYFVARIAAHLARLGKRVVGWDEILDGGAPTDAVIMAWRHAQKGIEAATAGHDVVMTPMSHCYFDHYQAKDGEPIAIGGFTPIETVYAFEPVPDGMPAESAHHVIGAQGNVWTEYMPDSHHVEYMALPRLCALAEVLWSPSDVRPVSDFLARLRPHLDQLGALGYNYRRLTD